MAVRKQAPHAFGQPPRESVGEAMLPRSTIAGVAAALVAAWGVTAPALQDARGIEATVAARIDRLLSEAYPANEPGAAVVVSRAGRVVFEKGYGLADTARRVPASPETVFRLASVTKALTSTALLMLTERGQLALDDPVTKLLPSYPSAGSTITVQHLLSHSSGLPDYLDRPDSMQWANQEYTVQGLIDAFKTRPAGFRPGEKTTYSNSNYVLLGAIIERISGQTLAAFLDSNVFRPLGMASSSCEGAWNDVPRLATAYEPTRTADGVQDWTRLVQARPYTRSALYAAGGCASSARDLGRFSGALLAGGLIGRPLLMRSMAPSSLAKRNDDTMSQGGWQLDRIQGRTAVMRGGALPGVCTWLLLVPDDGMAVVLLSNRTPGVPRCGMLARQIAEIALDGWR
jgi:D-alanyl-D-alanine carboxypeptidase